MNIYNCMILRKLQSLHHANLLSCIANINEAIVPIKQ